MAYKALMLSGVPNFAYTIGYTNASWTLKADLVAEYVCRLLPTSTRTGCGRRCRSADPRSGGAVHGLRRRLRAARHRPAAQAG